MRWRPLLLLTALPTLASFSAAGEGPAGATIVLPERLVAGEQATLAVLGGDGRLASNRAVEFSGGGRVTTDDTGRASFSAPSQPGVLLAQLPGTSTSASATVVASMPGSRPGLRLEDVPRTIALSERFRIAGSGFRGEADANRVRAGGKTAVVLAASPASLVVLPNPQAAPGPTQVVVEVGAAQAATPATLIALELSAAKRSLAPQESGMLTVRVRGSNLPLQLDVRNVTPDIVRLSGGNLQRVTTRGGDDNIVNMELKGLRAGDYSISLRLVPAAAGVPDIEAARNYLLKARGLAPPRWAHRVDKLIEELASHPQESEKVRDDLERMMAEQPSGEFGRLLESAWEVLLKR